MNLLFQMDTTWGISITRNILVSCWHEVFVVTIIIITKLYHSCNAYKKSAPYEVKVCTSKKKVYLSSTLYALVRSYFKIYNVLTVDSWEPEFSAVTEWVKLPGEPLSPIIFFLLFLRIFSELCSWPRTPLCCSWTQSSVKSRVLGCGKR